LSRVYRARGCVKKDARHTHHSGELYGFDRVSALIATRPYALAASEVAVVFGQDDDITLLILQRAMTPAI
jgi:hypothetical protein